MSRAIKFRAWDGEKVRYDVTGFEHGKDNEMGGVFLDGNFFTIEPDNDVAACIHNKAEVMQFTGLQDKNGVEIYEGDIVRDHVGVGQVKYSEKHGAFRVSYGDGLAKWFYDYILNGERESIEVIGNIHENPDLLGAK